MLGRFYVNFKISKLSFQSPAAPSASDSKGDYSEKEPTTAVPNNQRSQPSESPPEASTADLKSDDGGESKERKLSFRRMGVQPRFVLSLWSLCVELKSNYVTIETVIFLQKPLSNLELVDH